MPWLEIFLSNEEQEKYLAELKEEQQKLFSVYKQNARLNYSYNSSSSPEAEIIAAKLKNDLKSYIENGAQEETLKRLWNNALAACAIPMWWAFIRDMYDQKADHSQEALSRFKKRFVAEIKAQQFKAHKNANSFYFADLSGLELRNFDLKKVNLRYSNLSNANLNSSLLNEADLSHANLSRIDLTNVELSGANLTGANLSNAIYTHDQILSVEDLYQTKLGNRLSTYKKDHEDREALEDKIRESYEAKELDPVFLKIIQISGFSPLEWGNRAKDFNNAYDSLKQYKDSESSLVNAFKGAISIIVDPNHSEGYEKSRKHNPFKLFKQHEIRKTQISNLENLLEPLKKPKKKINIVEDDDKGEKGKEAEGTEKTPEKKQLESIVEHLFELSRQIRKEDNTFESKLLSQISNMCNDVIESRKEPKLTF